MKEDDTCRLSYREGREIRLEAGKPYMRAALTALIPAGILAGASLMTGLMDGTILSRPPDLDVLLAQGEISQPVYDYLKHYTVWHGPLIAGTIFGALGTIMAMVTLSDHASREALKKANEEKKPRDYRTEEEY